MLNCEISDPSEHYIDHDVLVRTANELPPLPQAVVRLSELFADPDYNIRDVVRAVELDPTLAAKLLRIANSANQGGGQVGSINEAIVRAGAGTIKALAISASVRPPTDLNLAPFGLTPASYWRHCVAVLCFAEEMSSQRIAHFGDDFTTAALLHDFGKLVLSKHLNEDHIRQLRQLAPSFRPVDREAMVISVNHAEVSAVVAQSWNLPDSLVRTLQYHHTPEEYGSVVCHGLNIANQLAKRLESDTEAYDREAESRAASMENLGIDEDTLDRIIENGSQRLSETLEVYSQ